MDFVALLATVGNEGAKKVNMQENLRTRSLFSILVVCKGAFLKESLKWSFGVVKKGSVKARLPR